MAPKGACRTSAFSQFNRLAIAMARPRSLPDSEVYATVLSLIAADGEKGVTFATVSRGTGLAGASLVQRYGGLDGMVTAALDWGWVRLDEALAGAEVHGEDRGPQALLKQIAEQVLDIPMAALIAASLRDSRLRDRASDWRTRVETALSTRTEAPQMLFAAWMGQMLWEPLGGKAFRLKDAARKLG